MTQFADLSPAELAYRAMQDAMDRRAMPLDELREVASSAYRFGVDVGLERGLKVAGRRVGVIAALSCFAGVMIGISLMRIGGHL